MTTGIQDLVDSSYSGRVRWECRVSTVVVTPTLYRTRMRATRMNFWESASYSLVIIQADRLSA